MWYEIEIFDHEELWCEPTNGGWGLVLRTNGRAEAEQRLAELLMECEEDFLEWSWR